MNITDNLNFRGKYKQYDPDGKPYLYRIGDVVDYRGVSYVNIKPTSTIVPGTPNADSVWKEFAAGNGFYIQETPPIATIEGERWYRPDVSVLYTLIRQENDLIWVEL